MKAIGVNDSNWSKHATNKEGKLCKGFILSAGVLLFITGAAKIVSALGQSPVLTKPDPIFGIHLNHLLLSVGLLELVAAVFCFTFQNRNLVLAVVAALSLNFLVYRIGLWATGWHGYCPCMGNMTEKIHLSRAQADHLSQMILTYLLLGSFAFLGYSWWAFSQKGKTALMGAP